MTTACKHAGSCATKGDETMQRMLMQTQLSNYDANGKFILECDSGWVMTMGRVREMLKLVPDLHIDVMCPMLSQCKTLPYAVNQDLFSRYENRLALVPHSIIPNALATRYDFDFDRLAKVLKLGMHKKNPALRYDHVYVNDPMHLRNLRALFWIRSGYLPRFFVHSHFIDNPECPKFPVEASLWLGQIEAAMKADFNFWQCESSMQVFLDSAMGWLREDKVAEIRRKSLPWDDGYSSEEINSPINMDNVRFDLRELALKTAGKLVVFVPNRIGGLGRSSDYTNCGKFMFEIVPRAWETRRDFLVIAGNPSQKILNRELEELCPAFLNLVPDALNRDEYKYVAKHVQDISVGIYNADSYGGTAARELCDIGTIPLWVDNYEYAEIARNVGWPQNMMIRPDLSDAVETTSRVIDFAQGKNVDGLDNNVPTLRELFQDEVRRRCSYEATTAEAIRHMGL